MAKCCLRQCSPYIYIYIDQNRRFLPFQLRHLSLWACSDLEDMNLEGRDWKFPAELKDLQELYMYGSQLSQVRARRKPVRLLRSSSPQLRSQSQPLFLQLPSQLSMLSALRYLGLAGTEDLDLSADSPQAELFRAFPNLQVRSNLQEDPAAADWEDPTFVLLSHRCLTWLSSSSCSHWSAWLA